MLYTRAAHATTEAPMGLSRYVPLLREVARPLRTHLMLASAAVVGIAAVSAQEYFARHWGGGPLEFRSLLLAQTLSIGLWFALGPAVILPLVRRFPFDGDLLLRNGTVHIASAVAMSVLHLGLVSCLFGARYFGWSPPAFWDVFRDRMHTTYVWDVLLYLAIAGVLHLHQRRQETLESAAGAQDRAGELRMAHVERGERPSVEVTTQPLDPASALVNWEVTGARVTERHLRRVLVKNDGRIGVVPVNDVSWIEAADNDVIVHTRTAQHTVRSTLTRLAARLDPERFVRVHRSTIVNVERVREVQQYFQGELVLLLEDSTRLTIGRTYRDGFLAVLEG